MEGSKNFLGIDWGERKVGISLAHAETRVAVAYTILENNAALFEELAKILKQEEVGTVVIGVPRYGKKIQHPAQVFGDQVEKRFGVSVVYQDEMFTSKLAQGNLALQGYQAVSQADDAEAAKILLEGWLER